MNKEKKIVIYFCIFSLILIIFLLIIFNLFFVKNSLSFEISNKSITGKTIDSQDCEIYWNSNVYTGTHDTPGLSNGDRRFLCYKENFYECGWEPTDRNLAYEVPNYESIGSWICNLNSSEWINKEEYNSQVYSTSWHILGSKKNEFIQSFGEYGDIPIVGYFDEDNIADMGVFRTYSKQEYNGLSTNWNIYLSKNDSLSVKNYGSISNNLPVPADYDGDGITDLAVVEIGNTQEDSSSRWLISQSKNGPKEENFGNFFYNWKKELDYWSDIPVPADYDGDGIDDIAFFRKSNGGWYIQFSSGEIPDYFNQFAKPQGDSSCINCFGYGGSGHVPVPADYDGDGIADLGIFNPIYSNWKILKSSGGKINKSHGSQIDIPVPADYDGDGIDDIAVFRKYPKITNFDYPLQDITQGHSDYDYEPFGFEEYTGITRIYSCGKSQSQNHLDGIYSSFSSVINNDYSQMEFISDGCSPGVLKVPGYVNGRCNGNPVYLLYVESAEDLQNMNGYGNRIEVSYSCDGKSWNFLGEVLKMDSPGNSFEDETWGLSWPYGTGHPKAIYLNKKIYLLYYEGDASRIEHQDGTYLAVSLNGEQFTKEGFIGNYVLSYLKYSKALNLFIGSISSEGEYLFFSKDIGKIENPFLSGPYEPVKDVFKLPQSKSCSGGAIVSSNPQGIIENKNNICYFISEWDGTCGTSPDRDISSSEIYLGKINFLYEDFYCVGNKYKECNIEDKQGVKGRECINNQWQEWSQCVLFDSIENTLLESTEGPWSNPSDSSTENQIKTENKNTNFKGGITNRTESYFSNGSDTSELKNSSWWNETDSKDSSSEVNANNLNLLKKTKRILIFLIIIILIILITLFILLKYPNKIKEIFLKSQNKIKELLLRYKLNKSL